MKIQIIVPLLVLFARISQATSFIDLTPGGFTPSVTGAGDPPIIGQATSQIWFDRALSPIFNRGPWLFANDNGLGGTYLFSNLFNVSPTANAQISWNFADQPNGDWLTNVVVAGLRADGTGIYNVYGVLSHNLRRQDGGETVTLDGAATIYGISFYGRNPAFPTPEHGRTFTMLTTSLVMLALVAYAITTEK